MKKRFSFLLFFAILSVTGYVASQRISTRSDAASFTTVPLNSTVPANNRVQFSSSSSKGYQGGCTAYLPEKTLKSDSVREEPQGEAKRVIDNFFVSNTQYSLSNPISDRVHFALVLAPDPIHTNLGIFFDREIVSVQQAAQDADYDYDSDWLPWKRDAATTFNNLTDRQFAQMYEQRRESCPGVLLFRRHMSRLGSTSSAAQDSAKSQPGSYNDALIVFVIGEQPTGGINHQQWANAILWMTSQPNHLPTDGILRVLGPTFSGSFPSLKREILAANSFSKVLMLSGSATSLSEIEAFHSDLSSIQLTKRTSVPNAHFSFGAFNENDELHISRFLEYLVLQGKNPEDVAILSEDETAYAVSDPETNYRYPSKPPDGGNPLDLKYPRDISVIRDAYQKQSVFESALPKGAGIRSILKSQSESAATEGLDSLPGYSGDISALDQEARLFGLLDHLRAHHIRYLILRSTNPLDLLFLGRFFHRAYPEARIVTVGSDLLFRREIDTTEFRGMLALSSYSLLAREPDWREMRVHPIFTGNISEGGYIAARYLFQQNSVEEWDKDTDAGVMTPLSFGLLEKLPAYGKPNWLHPEEKSGTLLQQPTWISTLGRDGYWPIAAIAATDKLPPSTLISLRKQENSVPKLTAFNLPLSANIAIALAFLLAIYQFWGVWDFKLFTSDDLFFVFVNNPLLPTQAFLRGLNSALAVIPLLELILPRYILYRYGYLEGSFWTVGLVFVTLLIIIFTFLVLSKPWSNKHKIVRMLVAIVFLSKHGSNKLKNLLVTLSFLFLPRKPLERYKSLRTILAFYRRSQPLSRRPKKHAEGEKGYTFRNLMLKRRIQRRNAGITYLLSLAVFLIIFRLLFFSSAAITDIYPLLYRMEHLTDGVSPLLPVLLITLSFYLWTWQTMAGNLMIGAGRPVLPLCTSQFEKKLEPDNFWWTLKAGIKVLYEKILGIVEAEEGQKESWKYLHPNQYRLSDGMAKQILLLANPFYIASFALLVLTCFLVASFYFCFHTLAKTLSLEGSSYNTAFTFILLFASLLTLVEAFYLFSTWVQLRRLLLALGRSRLSRAMKRLQPISATSLWTVSTNVHRVQYRLFFQQHEALNRLVYLHGLEGQDDCIQIAQQRGQYIVEKSRPSIRKGMAKLWWLSFKPDERNIRETFSDATAYLMNSILRPQWDKDMNSLYIERTSSPIETDLNSTPFNRKMEAAEEFVCVQYISFIHNIIARMRTMTMAMALLFASMCFALSFYPFVPRTYITTLLFVNFFIIGSIVAYVYAGMDRDEILSSIAATSPGHLGGEYWIKLASFLAGPVIGILATQYPSIVDSILSWMQPGLNAIK